MEKVEFELYGLTLLEPLGTAMNWLLAMCCLYWYGQLTGSDDKFKRLWSLFFLVYAGSFLFGGASHLFYNYLGLYGKIPGWTLAIFGAALAETGMVTAIPNIRKKQILQLIIRSKVFATLILLTVDLSFKWVMVDTAGLFLFVGIISYYRYKKGLLAYRFFLFGLSGLVLIAIVKLAALDIHPAWFNRHDIAHFIMVFMYWSFYRGIIHQKQIVPDSSPVEKVAVNA